MKECLYIPTLETERLILRKLVPEDTEDLRRWLGLDIVYKYWGHSANWNEKNPELLFIDPRPQIKRQPSHDFIWGIVCKEDGRVIGIMEIFNVQGDRIGSVAYRISPEYWNKGYCTEALGRTVQFIFSETSLERLSAEADRDNIASNAILLKCGFTHEGCVRNGKMGSRYCSYNIYGYIREDYEKPGNVNAGGRIEITGTLKEELDSLEKIYNEAFDSNPCPENMIIEDGDCEVDELSPAAAFEDKGKTVLSFHCDGELIGGAVITRSSPLNILDRLFISPSFQGKGLGFAAWQEIERSYSQGCGWILRCPTYLIKNACFYVNKCGFHIVGVEDVGRDGIGMFVYRKS